MLTGLRMRHWLSLVVGCALGLAVGLLITWQLWPVEYYNTDPIDLRSEHKEDYVVMIAAAYSQDADLDSATSRLEALGFEDARQAVLDLFERYNEAGYEGETTSLARLAYDMGVKDVALLRHIRTPTATAELTPSPTPSPVMEPTVAPTSTKPAEEPTATATEAPPEPTPTATEPVSEPSPTPTAAGEFDFRLVEQTDLGCSADQAGSQILVYIQDEHGRGLAGVEVMVSAAEGEDAFFTGLKPEVDPGFADFVVTAAGTYTVQVLDGESQVAEDIAFGEDCPADTPNHLWRVVFRRPGE
jgi:hypothetical protein